MVLARRSLTFVPTIFEASDSAFKAQTHRIYRAPNAASYVEVSVVR